MNWDDFILELLKALHQFDFEYVWQYGIFFLTKCFLDCHLIQPANLADGLKFIHA